MAIQNIPTEKIQAFIDKAMADYAPFRKDGDTHTLTFDFEVGSSYIKVTHNSYGQTGVHSFIVNKVKPGQRYKSRNRALVKVGDILMAASWKAPALNFARGNIDDLENVDVRWTGV